MGAEGHPGTVPGKGPVPGEASAKGGPFPEREASIYQDGGPYTASLFSYTSGRQASSPPLHEACRISVELVSHGGDAASYKPDEIRLNTCRGF